MPANGDEAVTLKQLLEFGETLGGGGPETSSEIIFASVHANGNFDIGRTNWDGNLDAQLTFAYRELFNENGNYIGVHIVAMIPEEDVSVDILDPGLFYFNGGVIGNTYLYTSGSVFRCYTDDTYDESATALFISVFNYDAMSFYRIGAGDNADEYKFYMNKGYSIPLDLYLIQSEQINS